MLIQVGVGCLCYTCSTASVNYQHVPSLPTEAADVIRFVGSQIIRHGYTPSPRLRHCGQLLPQLRHCRQMSVQEFQHIFLPIRTFFRGRSRSPSRVSATAYVLPQSFLQSLAFGSEHELCIGKVTSFYPLLVGKRRQIRGPSQARVCMAFD